MATRIALGLGNYRLASGNDDFTLFKEAVNNGGGRLVTLEDAEGLIWLSLDGAELKATLQNNPNISWVQLPWAGVDAFAKDNVFEMDVQFTSAKGAFAPEVAEHALFLILACLRNATRMARSKSWNYVSPSPGGMFNKRVTVLGGGAIATRTVQLCKAAGANVTVLRKRSNPVSEADRTLSIEHLDDVLTTTDILVACLALTSETTGMISHDHLAAMPRGSFVVNVARGKIIDTDALVSALVSGHIAAAGLDVTEPEPLPDGHPLWAMDNVLITSHSSNSDEYCDNALAERISENVRRFNKREELLGLIDNSSGY